MFNKTKTTTILSTWNMRPIPTTLKKRLSWSTLLTSTPDHGSMWPLFGHTQNWYQVHDVYRAIKTAQVCRTIMWYHWCRLCKLCIIYVLNANKHWSIQGGITDPSNPADAHKCCRNVKSNMYKSIIGVVFSSTVHSVEPRDQDHTGFRTQRS